MKEYHFISFVPLLLKGLWTTLQLWLCASVISFSVGACLGIVSCKHLGQKLIQNSIRMYVFVIRGIPLYVQILIMYFVLPELLGINLSAFTAAVFALGICSSAYVAEIVRAGLNAIDKGQWDACKVLGYTRTRALLYVILPQVTYKVLPALTNELEMLIKSTALLSMIGVLELTKIGSNIVARYMNPVPVYLSIACFYLLLSTVVTASMNFIEKRIAYD